MKYKKLLWIVLVVILITGVIFVCNYMEQKNSRKSPKALLPATELVIDKLGSAIGEWYNSISSIMIDNDNPSEEAVAQEYIIANSISFQGIEHINIIVFADGTGRLTQKFYNSEFESEGEMVFDESISLTEEQVMQAVNVFESNHFWEIPSEHPDESLGLDGNTIFIEGTDGNKYNIISMWCPGDKYEIKKIYNEIISLAELWGLTISK